MGKKKKSGKKDTGGAPEVVNAEIEFPPARDQMSLLYRKASFDVRPPGHEPWDELIKYQMDQTHRAVVPGYCKFLRERRFWMSGDDVPDGAIPSVPAPPKAKAGGGKKKKK